MKKKTFKDILVKFTLEEYVEIRSSFEDIVNLVPDEDFNPLEYGFTQQQIDDGEAPESEFEYDMRRCFEDFNRAEIGYTTDGTNYILLCQLIGQMLSRYVCVLDDVGEFNPSDTDMAEDLMCICDAAKNVLDNPAFGECKKLAIDLRK